MANDISLPQPNINPGVVGGSSGYAPNALDTFLASFIDSRKQASSESAQARQDAIAQGHLDLAREEMKYRQEQERTQQSQQDAQGGAIQGFLKMLQPLGEATAQKAMASGQDPLSSLFGGQQGQGSPIAMGGPQAPAQTPMVPPTPVSAQPQGTPNWSQLTENMSPGALSGFIHEDLPNLLALQKQMQGGSQNAQMVQYGKGVTTFVPGKGFWDPTKNAFVPSLERGRSADEEADRALDRQVKLEQIQTQQAYRQGIMAQSQTRQFNGRTKDLQQRGAMINQAIQTISDAQNNPDPAQRRVLTSSAIANFVQAADQKAALRYQMLNYFKNNVDPSIGGKWEVLKTRLIQGTLPKYVTGGLLHHLGNLLQLTGSEYDKQRSAEVKRHPDLGNWLPEKDEFFSPMTVNGTSSDPSGDPGPPP